MDQLYRQTSGITGWLKNRCGLLVAMLLISATSFAQQPEGAATGTVLDENGAPVIGVVVTSATNQTAVTDGEGYFRLSPVAVGETLHFSTLGMTPQDVVFRGQPLVVTMVVDATSIEDVIVVGYGTVRKSDMTGAVAVLGDTKLKTVTTPRVEDMLNGKVPGVFVGSGTSQPGSTGVIIIRGKTSINASTNPLWVIDGVIMGTAAGDINPADIESMTVLKDAASTAIYGSQGSNGVIIVTTKKGRAGKATVSLSAKAGMNYMNEGNLKMMNGAQLYDLFNAFPNREAIGGWFTPDVRNRNFSWKDAISQTGVTQDYNISIRGGTDKLTAYASLGYYDETGTVKGFDYSRYSGRLNVDWKVFDWLTVKPSVSIARRDLDNQQLDPSVMYNYLPWNSAYNEDGTLVGRGNEATPAWVGSNGSSSLYNRQWNYSWDRFHEAIASFDFTVKITDWLAFESVNNYRMNTFRGFAYTDPRTLDNTQGGSIYNATNEASRYYFNHLLRFNKTFNEDHHVTAIAAYEWNSYYYDAFNTTKLGIPVGADNLALAATPSTTSGSVSDWAMQSYFLNATYAYQNRFFAQASVRRDGSSRFGEDNRYGTFFSVSGSWNIHEENFFENARNTVNQLKLRASYGSTGNLPGELYGNYDTYSLSASYAYNGENGALMSGLAGNKEMTWETTYTTNVGIDLSMWNSRLNVTLDVYDKATSGLLWSTPLPSVWGVTSVWRNVGNVNNKGIEISIDGDVIRNENWRWNIGANFGSNKNKVVELFGGMTERIASGDSNIAGSADKLWKVGYDMDTWYLPEWAGVDPTDGTPQWYTNDENGREITKSMNNAKPVMLGKYTPKFYGGFNTTLNWKFLDLNAVFSYSYGGKIFNYARVQNDSDGVYLDTNQMALQKGWSRWEKPGDIATHPEPRLGGNNGSNGTSSRFLENASYLKLKNLTLGANIPLESKVISALRVYVSGENLFTITKYSGTDPEIPVDDQGTGNYKISGTGRALYPGVTRVMFGVNLTF